MIRVKLTKLPQPLDTVAIGGVVFTFQTNAVKEGEIKIGATTRETAKNFNQAMAEAGLPPLITTRAKLRPPLPE